MKPHPRLRKTIKWTGAAVMVVLTVTWFSGGWWWRAAYPNGTLELGIGNGALWATRLLPGNRDLVIAVTEVVRESTKKPYWQWTFSRSGATNTCVWSIDIPMWWATALVAIPTTVAWRLDIRARRRAQAHLCPKCNYDRTGLATSARCPECGNKPVNP